MRFSILADLDFIDEDKTEYLAKNFMTNAKKVLEIYPNGARKFSNSNMVLWTRAK